MRDTNNPFKEMEHQTERLLTSVLPFFADYDGVIFGPYSFQLPFAYDADTVRMTYDTREAILDAVRNLELPHD